MKCLLLFSLLLFYNGATADELQLKKEPGEIVQEVIDRFEKIAETSVDLTEKLALIRDTSAAFIKLAVPLGALLAASLDIVKKESPESEEYKALKKLNKQMNYQFDRKKHFFFKKALPNSTSFDSTLAGQAKPKTKSPTSGNYGGQPYVPCTPSSALDHQHLHQLSSPISCSSTQGTIGCAIGNELFDQCRSSWQIMPLENATTPNAAQCPAALLNCRQPLLMLPPPPPPAGSTSPQQQQVTAAVVRSKNG
uniref:Uncharacterized protein n=1 Tax=Globodera pallida TaxID=36090 RepID=A0A183BVK2_GLOPA